MATAADGTRGSLIARNTLLNLVGLTAPLLAAVVAIPVLVEGMGTERFGVLGLIWVVTAYLNLLDLGLGRATTRFAASALARGAGSDLRGIVGVAALWQLVLGTIGGLVTALAAAPLVHDFLNLSPVAAQEAYWSFLTMAGAAPAIAMTSSFRGMLEADQRFGVINAVRVPVSAANFLVPLGGVWLGLSLPAIVAGMAAVRIAALIAFATICLREWPALRGAVSVERERLRELLRFGGWVTVSSIAAALLLYVDRFVLGGIESVRAVGYYTVPQEMVVRLEVLPASLVLTLFPALAALNGSGGHDAGARLRRSGALVVRSVEALLLLVVPLFVVLAIFASDVLTLWLGASFAAAAATSLRLLATGMALTALAYVPYAAIHAAGRPDLTARIHLLEVPVYAVMLVALTAAWGIEGAALAWALRAILDALLVFGVAARLGLFGEWTAERRAEARPVKIVAAVIAFAVAAAAASLVAGTSAALATVSVVFLLWLAGVWRWWLSGDERRRLAGVFGAGR